MSYCVVAAALSAFSTAHVCLSGRARDTWKHGAKDALLLPGKVAALHFNSKDKTVMCFLFVTFQAFLFLFLRIVKPESGTLFFSSYNLDE